MSRLSRSPSTLLSFSPSQGVPGTISASTTCTTSCTVAASITTTSTTPSNLASCCSVRSITCR